MSAVNMMDDDLEDDAPPRPRKRKAPPKPARAKAGPSRKAAPRRRVRVEEEEPDAPLGPISGWIADVRARMKRSAAFTGAVGGFFAVVALTGVIAGGHVPKAIADTRAAVFGFFGEAGLKVQSVKVVGAALMPQAEIDAAIGLIPGESSIFEADPQEIRARLEARPWVAHAEVRRVWPNRIEVLIVERRPMALWQLDGKLQVIDRDGTPITAHDPQRFANLLRVVGPGAAEQASRLVDLLGREPGLKPRVAMAILVGQRRWNLRLDNGVEVRLPEEGADAALSELAQLDREQQILAREIDAIDFRFPDRLIIKLPEGSQLTPHKPAVEGRDT
jgi:cell division protein FtsQ